MWELLEIPWKTYHENFNEFCKDNGIIFMDNSFNVDLEEYGKIYHLYNEYLINSINREINASEILGIPLSEKLQRIKAKLETRINENIHNNKSI